MRPAAANRVTAEVVVDNKDIGFVGAGQVAAIKLETFPFTRYGTVPATVKSVVADAVNDEKTGAIFPAVLSPNQANIDIDGKRINLSPGMNLTAEIKTGKRRVIEYLLSPGKSDNKVLGELVTFGRRGSDGLGPGEPSSHVCPRGPTRDIEIEVFRPEDK